MKNLKENALIRFKGTLQRQREKIACLNDAVLVKKTCGGEFDW